VLRLKKITKSIDKINVFLPVTFPYTDGFRPEFIPLQPDVNDKDMKAVQKYSVARRTPS
jgi:hypothetical protein